MKALVAAIALAGFTMHASAASCVATAKERKLSGAAEKSFMTKCTADAKASCEAQAKEKKLAGAAQSSFMKKCVADATGG
jgi:hypothetical protein